MILAEDKHTDEWNVNTASINRFKFIWELKPWVTFQGSGMVLAWLPVKLGWGRITKFGSLIHTIKIFKYLSIFEKKYANIWVTLDGETFLSKTENPEAIGEKGRFE